MIHSQPQRIAEAWQAVAKQFALIFNSTRDGQFLYNCNWPGCWGEAATCEAIPHIASCPIGIISSVLPLLAPGETDNELGRLYNEVYAMVDFLEGYLDGLVCDAGNPDGGSVESCEHCQLTKWKERLEKIDTTPSALKQAVVADSTPNPAPVWKREKPSVDGFYWYKVDRSSPAQPAEVNDGCFYIIGSINQLRLERWGGWWCGPLVAPAIDGGEK